VTTLSDKQRNPITATNPNIMNVTITPSKSKAETPLHEACQKGRTRGTT